MYAKSNVQKRPAPLGDAFPPIVTYHSFHETVEQTLQTVGLTQTILQQGAKVLLIDGNLDAPSLTWLIRDRYPNPSISFADFFAILHSDPDPTFEESLHLLADRIREMFVDGVYLLPAFRLVEQFASLQVTPEHLIQGSDDPFIVTHSLARLGQLLDVQAIIVDLRSGFSALSMGLQLDPRVYRVLVTKPDSLSLKGTHYLLDLLLKLAPPEAETEPHPYVIMAQAQNGDENTFSNVVEPLFGQNNGNTGFSYHVNDFSALTALPASWDAAMKQIKQSNIINETLPMLSWLPNLSPVH